MSEFKQLPIKVDNYLSSLIDKYKEAKRLNNLSKMIELKRTIKLIQKLNK